MANMRKRSKKTVDRTNRELEETEQAILRGSSTDWEALRLEVADSETYDQLIAEVQAATVANESLAALEVRLKKLGTVSAGVIKKVIDLAS